MSSFCCLTESKLSMVQSRKGLWGVRKDTGLHSQAWSKLESDKQEDRCSRVQGALKITLAVLLSVSEV